MSNIESLCMAQAYAIHKDSFVLIKVEKQVKNKEYKKVPTEKKKVIIDSLQQIFAQANSGIMTDYRGLKTSDVVSLRRKLRDIGVEYHVVKNTLERKPLNRRVKTRLQVYSKVLWLSHL